MNPNSEFSGNLKTLLSCVWAAGVGGREGGGYTNIEWHWNMSIWFDDKEKVYDKMDHLSVLYVPKTRFFSLFLQQQGPI